MKKLNELTVAELRAEAKELGIALSYTQEDGKRHKLNKPELIVAIESKQAESSTIEAVEVVETIQEVNENAGMESNGFYKFENTVAKSVNKFKKLLQSERSFWLVYDDINAHIENMIETYRKNKALVSQWIKAKKVVDVIYNLKRNKIAVA